MVHVKGKADQYRLFEQDPGTSKFTSFGQLFRESAGVEWGNNLPGWNGMEGVSYYVSPIFVSELCAEYNP